MNDFWIAFIGAIAGAAVSGGAFLWYERIRNRKDDPVIRRTDLTQTRVEPDRDGQRVTRNPDSESHRRKTFSTKRRGSTEAHMSQPRKFW